jgi:hypothetical protein
MNTAASGSPPTVFMDSGPFDAACGVAQDMLRRNDEIGTGA